VQNQLTNKPLMKLIGKCYLVLGLKVSVTGIELCKLPASPTLALLGLDFLKEQCSVNQIFRRQGNPKCETQFACGL